MLFGITAALLTSSGAAGESPHQTTPPRLLRVAIDDNYPPYVFRDASGALTGYLVELWRLWETKTGVRVELLGSDWATAQQRMADRQTEVIDTVFRTPEREKTLDFSPPYENIPVSIYSQAGIGGIVDIDTLHGFLVGVKAGDACVDTLAEAGLTTIQPFASYEDLVRGAVEGKVRVFCLDEPPANYLLYRKRAEHQFNRAFTLYSGEFHRAVHKGNRSTLALLESGYAAIPASELRALRQKWMGTPVASSPATRLLGYALLVGSLVAVLLLVWVVTLRRIVRQRTTTLKATLEAIPDPMFELGLDGRYYECHSPRRDLLAAAPDRLIGRRVSDVLPEQASAVCLSALREAQESGYSTGRQFELSLPGGKHWFELSVARKPTGEGQEARFVVLSRDITARKWAEAALRRRSEQLELLSAAGQEINRRLDVPVILRRLVGAALKLTRATGGAAARLSAGQMVFTEYYRNGQWLPVDYRFAAGHGVPGRVMQTRRFHLSNDAGSDPWVVPEIRQAIGFDNLLDMPIVSRHGDLLGCFEIHDKPGGFDESDARLLQGLAASAAVAIENTALLAQRGQAEQALRASEALKASVLANAACGIVATDPRGLITVFNPGAEAIFGYLADEVVGQVTPTLWHDSDEIAATAATLSRDLGFHVEPGFDALVARARNSGEADEREMIGVRKDGRRITIRLAVTVMRDAQGTLGGYLATIVDITQHKDAEASIQRLAHFDSLTGLPNRSLLAERARHDLARAQRGREALALMFLDLDRFKNVNDSLGHRIGDALLIQLAERLRRAVRDEDTVSRLGGDEFIVLLPNTDADGAAHVAAKLLDITAPAYRIEQHELNCTLSVGIAIYPADGKSFEALSMSADTAMYRAKQRGRNGYCFFTPEMQEKSARNLQIENDLRRALDKDELHLHFQAQFALADRRLVGAEALLRWQHPQLGAIPPTEFIPIAEESGLILTIGEWALRAAARQARQWQHSGLPPMTVAVNLSAVQFRQANLTDRLSCILDEEQMPAQFLELELTESAAMDNPLAAIATMDKLRARGVRMAIDDFGTGYSSMSYLRRFHVHKLKIDRSFVADLAADPEDEAIVAATISLARNLGLQTLAEGVENEAQLAFLRDKGCDEAQGYLFSEPLPAAQFEAFVRDHAKPAVSRP
ncbi:EAL domain-containing protein [Accumulibacter sp.]|uniref:EAL domain-containing protein n=1 Tax=Accumulibacter sp. TaxID=2053492 RepID=UPI002633003D|nr:EAL domain-containing protein [Accumulibacter sp.]